MSKKIDYSSIDKILSTKNSEHTEYLREVLEDFWICLVSRDASIVARKEVLSGKAKFGIVGDGKEVPQVAMAKAFRKGDFRSGYYRDQTLMFALDLMSVEDYFAQLYADTFNDLYSGGRQMNCHFATPLVSKDGEWISHLNQFNISSDVSSTGGQMARALGLAFASKKYRELDSLKDNKLFSDNGNEVVFCTIGDASTSEGVFWESINAAAVLQVPLAISVWDDGYGISVPIRYQTVKSSISDALRGFESDLAGMGIRIVTVDGWNYPALCSAYIDYIEMMREDHKPVLFHVKELTQPQGHSTSGSHERYKSAERLEWERQHDCITVMKNWLIENNMLTQDEADELQDASIQYVRACKNKSWQNFNQSINDCKYKLEAVFTNSGETAFLEKMGQFNNPVISDYVKLGRKAYRQMPNNTALLSFLKEYEAYAEEAFHSHLYSQSQYSALNVAEVKKEFSENSPTKNGFEVLNAFWDKTLEQHPEFMAFGEDVGQIGGVNQTFMGMQLKYGVERVFDTGIREWTIVGQALGLAMRGLRPISEIQYLDYLVYALPILTDDVATLRYRTDGIQKAPVIIRTRGHRLEGIWHAGSPIGMMLHSLRGMYILTPRNFTQAAGLYNTMLQSDDSAVIVECLNGYRLKEKLPDNIGTYTVPLGVPEVLNEGSDITIVTYGSCVRIAEEACKQLEELGIQAELIDLQTLIPFDLTNTCLNSIKKTNRLLVLDEDVPGGASAYILQQLLEKQDAYHHLDSKPKTLTASPHRPPYGSDGDYFTKPSVEDIVEVIYNMMAESNPQQFTLNLPTIEREGV